MAIFHLSFSNGKVGKGASHFDYISGEGKYDYKEKEVLYAMDKLPPFAKSPRDFWKAADENERLNGRVYKEIRISLPKELTLEENKELLNEFLKKELGDYYFSVRIHSKESSVEGINNIHAHIMVCPRKIDGIERDEKQFFKKYNSKHPERGGAEKDPYWNRVDTLLHFRKSWEETLNNTLREHGIEEVSCKSLKDRKKEALEKGDELLAEKLDRDPVNIEGYILKKSEKNYNEMDKVDYEVFQINKQIKEKKDLLYEYSKAYEQQLEAARNDKVFFNNINSTMQEYENNNKQLFNVYDIKENILMLEIEKKYLMQQEDSAEKQQKLASINIELEKNTIALNNELSSLKDGEFEEKYSKLNALSFTKDYQKLIQVSKENKKLENEVKKIEDKLSNLDVLTYSILTKGAYGKLYNELLKTTDQQKTQELKNKLKDLSKQYSRGNGKNIFIRKKAMLEKQYKKSFLDKQEQLEKSKYLKEALLEKIDLYKKENALSDTYKEMDNHSLYLKNMCLKNKKIYSNLKNINCASLVLNKLSGGKYNNILKTAKPLLDRQRVIEQQLKDISTLDSAAKIKLEKELIEIKLNIEELNKQFGKINQLVNTEEFRTQYASLNEKINSKAEEFYTKFENSKEEEKVYNKFVNSFKKDVSEKSKEKHGGGRLPFVSNLRANIGEIKNSGCGIKLSSSDDTWEKRAKKELDFFS